MANCTIDNENENWQIHYNMSTHFTERKLKDRQQQDKSFMNNTD